MGVVSVYVYRARIKPYKAAIGSPCGRQRAYANLTLTLTALAALAMHTNIHALYSVKQTRFDTSIKTIIITKVYYLFCSSSEIYTSH